jgi:hypothetical protein
MAELAGQSLVATLEFRESDLRGVRETRLDHFVWKVQIAR